MGKHSLQGGLTLSSLQGGSTFSIQGLSTFPLQGGAAFSLKVGLHFLQVRSAFSSRQVHIHFKAVHTLQGGPHAVFEAVVTTI